MSTDIGNENEIIIQGKYFGLFNKLVSLVSKNQGLKTVKIIDILKNEYNEEEIRFSIRYLISQKFFVCNNSANKFDNLELLLSKEPSILLAEDEESEPSVVLTLPPFNYFGLKSSLESHEININFIKDEIKKLFLEAEETINICSPFIDFEGIKDFLPLLIFKCCNGVEIKIISRQIDQKDRNSRFNKVKPIFDYFKKYGCDIQIKNYHYQSTEYIDSSTHAKFIVVDGKRSYVGSGELRKNSFEKNFELGVILGNKHSKELNIIFDDIFSISNGITFER